MTPPRTWIFYSGLPKILGQFEVGLLRALVDLEAIGAVTDRGIEVSLAELAGLTGGSALGCSAGLQRLIDLRLIQAFIADNDEESCLVRLREDMPCPRTWNWVRDHTRLGEYLKRTEERGGATKPIAYRDTDPDPDSVEMGDVIDAYFNHVSMRADAMLADRLAGLVRTFGEYRCKKVFEECGQKNRKSPMAIPRGLGWCEGELRRRAAAEAKREEERRKREEVDMGTDEHGPARTDTDDAPLPFAGQTGAWD